MLNSLITILTIIGLGFGLLFLCYVIARIFNPSILNQDEVDALFELSIDDIPFKEEDLPLEEESADDKRANQYNC